MNATGSPPPVSTDVAERLAELLPGDVPDGRAVLADLRGLVGALVGQVAAGQVETLYSLQTAAAAVRRHTAEWESAAARPLDRLAEILGRVHVLEEGFRTLQAQVTVDLPAQVAAAVREQIAALVDERLETATAVMAQAAVRVEDVAAELGAQTQLLANTATNVRDGLARTTEQTVDKIAEVSGAAAEGLARVGRETVTGVERASSGLTASVSAASAGLMTTTEQIATGLLASAERVTAALVAASERNADDIGQVGILLVDTLSARVEAFFRELDDVLVVTAEQNQQLELELEARVDTLVARTDEAVTRLSQRLGEQADRLLARDDHLENARAEAFTHVLEGLLSRAGGQRALRKRVREVVAFEPDPTPDPPAPVPSAPAAPEPVAVRPAARTVVEALPTQPVRATAPAKKVPAKTTATKTPAKKAPAKKTLAKKTLAKKTLAKKAAPTPRTTRTKEDSS